MAKLGASPSLEDMKRTDNVANLSPESLNAMRAVGIDPTISRDQELMNRYAAFVTFYQNKGYSLMGLNEVQGFYSSGSYAQMRFTKPNPTESEGDGHIVVTFSHITSFDRSYGGGKQTTANIIDFNGDTRASSRPGGTAIIKPNRNMLAVTSVSSSIHGDGFSHPLQVHKFIQKVNPKYADSKIVKGFEGNQKITEPVDPADNQHYKELAPALGTSARLAYIQDIGRYAQATGIDALLTPFHGDIHYIFSNRNAMVQQYHDGK